MFFEQADELGIVDDRSAKANLSAIDIGAAVDELAAEGTLNDLSAFDPIPELAVRKGFNLVSEVVLQTQEQEQRKDGVRDGKLGLFLEFHALFSDTRTRSATHSTQGQKCQLGAVLKITGGLDRVKVRGC